MYVTCLVRCLVRGRHPAVCHSLCLPVQKLAIIISKGSTCVFTPGRVRVSREISVLKEKRYGARYVNRGDYVETLSCAN